MEGTKKVFYGIEEYYNEIATDDVKLREMSKVNEVCRSHCNSRKEEIKENMKVFVCDCIDWFVL